MGECASRGDSVGGCGPAEVPEVGMGGAPAEVGMGGCASRGGYGGCATGTY